MALSSRAHAFSVEAIMGAKRKRAHEEGGAEEPHQGPEKRPKSAPPSPKPAAQKESGVQVELQGGELWRRFHQIGTEMIITKAGRRMFPSVRVKVKGLDPSKQYFVALDVVPVDSKRYRYVYHSSQWMVAGNTENSCLPPRLYVHADSPCSGETWMRQVISFDRVKLTNNEMDDKGHITKLKIDRNPFAKGFRDPGRNRVVMDGLLEHYPWRSSLSLDFKAFGADTPGRSSGSSPLTSRGGVPSPLLSPSCSPPTFQLPARSLHCSETYLHPVSAPFYYKVCPGGLLRPRSLLDKRGAPGGHILSPVMVDVPFLSSFGFCRHNKLETFRDSVMVGAAASSPVLCGIPTSGNILPSAALARDALSCSFHSPYGFYGYNLAVPSHLITAAASLKMTDTCPEASRWTPPSVNHCL